MDFSFASSKVIIGFNFAKFMNLLKIIYVLLLKYLYNMYLEPWVVLVTQKVKENSFLHSKLITGLSHTLRKKQKALVT